MLIAYLRYLSRARDEHSLHSPFVFSLYTQVIRDKNRQNSIFGPIEHLRRELIRTRDAIQITDLGAGSKVNPSGQRSIGDIARHSQKPARFGRLLYRLIQRFGAKTSLDLGTSLGLTTAYMAQACQQQGRIITFEGCRQTADVAQGNFDKLGIRNVEIVVGNIDQTLPEKLATLDSVDLVFFDANHRYEPTIRYFENCLSKSHNDTVFIFDDIHWSDGMERAWAAIKAHPAVIVTIDLFWVGLVFVRREQPRQDFVLRF